MDETDEENNDYEDVFIDNTNNENEMDIQDIENVEEENYVEPNQEAEEIQEDS